MTKVVDQAALERAEGRLMLVTPIISHALHNLLKTLSRGFVRSEMRGAVMDLRAAANRIEQIEKEWPE